jgi:hypothetical protein
MHHGVVRTRALLRAERKPSRYALQFVDRDSRFRFSREATGRGLNVIGWFPKGKPHKHFLKQKRKQHRARNSRSNWQESHRSADGPYLLALTCPPDGAGPSVTRW